MVDMVLMESLIYFLFLPQATLAAEEGFECVLDLAFHIEEYLNGLLPEHTLYFQLHFIGWRIFEIWSLFPYQNEAIHIFGTSWSNNIKPIFEIFCCRWCDM